MKVSYIPKEILHIILEYDGRIKYKKGDYINIIHKHDERYNVITPILRKKMDIIKNIEFDNSGFYFHFNFDQYDKKGLCYDYNFSYENIFEVCYYNAINGIVEQSRTQL